jgi:hypothetical protein
MKMNASVASDLAMIIRNTSPPYGVSCPRDGCARRDVEHGRFELDAGAWTPVSDETQSQFTDSGDPSTTWMKPLSVR